MRSRAGFTLVELIVALVLFGLVGTSIYQLLVTNQRLYREQSERVNTNQGARIAASLLPSSLRELSATDDRGSDIITADSSRLRFRALKNLYFACQDGSGTTIVLWATPWYGLRAINATTDSVILYGENDPDTRADDVWMHANITAATTGTACPGGAASISLTIAGLSGGASTGVLQGAPVRAFQHEEIRLYQDANRDYWLGGVSYPKSGSASVQPIIGPMSQDGLSIDYYDATGAVTATVANIASIGIMVRAQSGSQVRNLGTWEYLTQDIDYRIALRNNCRYSC